MRRVRVGFGVALALALVSAGAAMPARAQMGYGHGMMGQGTMGRGGTGSGMMGAPSAPPAAGSAGASTEGGRVFANRCALCHALRAGAPAMAGPDLHGLFGRPAGVAPGYDYSAALRRSGIVWRGQTLDAFLAAPQRAVPGNRMPFAGIADRAERRALIRYLRTATR